MKNYLHLSLTILIFQQSFGFMVKPGKRSANYATAVFNENDDGKMFKKGVLFEFHSRKRLQDGYRELRDHWEDTHFKTSCKNLTRIMCMIQRILAKKKPAH